MSEGTTQNSVRYVVSGRHSGGIVPGRRDEMWRDVFLKAGTSVDGGVFGNTIRVEGAGVTIHGAVYARGAIKINATSQPGGEADEIEFRSVVSSPDSVVTVPGNGNRVRFHADVFAGQARIQNAFIRGNVYAKNAILRDCVVLGGVFCSGELTTENVILSTFRAGRVSLQPELFLFYPFALCDTPIALDFAARSLSFARLTDLAGDEDLESFPVVSLAQDDVVEISEEGDGEPKHLSLISLGTRILDLYAASKQFKANAEFLARMALGDHLPPAERIGFDSGELRRVDERLRDLLQRPPSGEFNVGARWSDVEKRQRVQEFMASMNVEAQTSREGGGSEEMATPRGI